MMAGREAEKADDRPVDPSDLRFDDIWWSGDQPPTTCGPLRSLVDGRLHFCVVPAAFWCFICYFFFCVWICLARPPDQDFAGLINWNRGLAEFVSATFFEKCSVKRYPLGQVIAWSSGSCRRMRIWRSTSQESVPWQMASWTQYPHGSHGSSVQSQSFGTSISSAFFRFLSLIFLRCWKAAGRQQISGLVSFILDRWAMVGSFCPGMEETLQLHPGISRGAPGLVGLLGLSKWFNLSYRTTI